MNPESFNGETNTNWWQRIIFELRRRRKKDDRSSERWKPKIVRWSETRERRGIKKEEKTAEGRVKTAKKKRGKFDWQSSRYRRNEDFPSGGRRQLRTAHLNVIRRYWIEPSRTGNNVSTDCYRATTIAMWIKLDFERLGKNEVKRKLKSWSILN